MFLFGWFLEPKSPRLPHPYHDPSTARFPLPCSSSFLSLTPDTLTPPETLSSSEQERDGGRENGGGGVGVVMARRKEQHDSRGNNLADPGHDDGQLNPWPARRRPGVIA